jgi:hypothetical protein
MTSNDVLDWDDLSDEDKQKAMEFIAELNKIFDKYPAKEDVECEDSILDD